MTNNDLNVAYVHSDLKLANIVVKTKSQGEELASRGDHCDITPRISLIDFGGMFRFTSSKVRVI